MYDIKALALTFAICLAATIIMAAFFRLMGRIKPSLLNVAAIPVGITISESVRMGSHISGTAFIIVVTGAVGVSVFCTQFIKVQRGISSLKHKMEPK
ncbi:hypothetical protein B1757_10370 [Acidithiobacillus marinus]|uniref:Uncharacterized protein n=1 Tax=Acidithiobacillus marinus TaxID=187490 RepID=A0A2I1DKC3_9PROT|nr:hypothetical protein [Acidithiobacillus marinus]PKY10323.1 hypothetical protein B1757_10370 [Acidithiobacillus marinus]